MRRRPVAEMFNLVVMAGLLVSLGACSSAAPQASNAAETQTAADLYAIEQIEVTGTRPRPPTTSTS